VKIRTVIRALAVGVTATAVVGYAAGSRPTRGDGTIATSSTGQDKKKAAPLPTAGDPARTYVRFPPRQEAVPAPPSPEPPNFAFPPPGRVTTQVEPKIDPGKTVHPGSTFPIRIFDQRPIGERPLTQEERVHSLREVPLADLMKTYRERTVRENRYLQLRALHEATKDELKAELYERLGPSARALDTPSMK